MSAPAGWLPDPDDTTQLRFWDGSSWTDFRSPADAPPPDFSPATDHGDGADTARPSAAPAGVATSGTAWKLPLAAFGALLFIVLVISLLAGR